MTAAVLRRDVLMPRAPGGMGRGLLLALLVHGALVVALTWGVRWRASEPEGLQAELWASVPQQAAPPAPAPAPAPPPAPTPAPAPPPPPPPAARAPAEPDPQIAIEKARREAAEQRRREEAEKLAEKRRRDEELAEQRRREEERAELRRREEQAKLAEQRRRAEEDKRRAEEDKRRAEAERRHAAELEQQRQKTLERMLAQAGAAGDPSSTGTAARSAGPSAGYAGRIKARIKPNIVFVDQPVGNPVAEIELKLAPDGTIVGQKLIKASGLKEWDEAVQRAIDRTQVLPRDVDGTVPSSMVIAFRPRD